MIRHALNWLHNADRPRMAAASHCGLVRACNEDSYLCVTLPNANDALLAVADGVGGHEGGEIASYFALQRLLAARLETSGSELKTPRAAADLLQRALANANHLIYHANQTLAGRFLMGTTVVAAVFVAKSIVVAHAGDSRCYRLRNNKLQQLTRDHTWVEAMVQKGTLTREEATTHPWAHMLSNCIGARPDLAASVQMARRRAGDRYVLCSDGVSALLADAAISQILKDAQTPGDAVSALIEQCLRRGGIDNISAAVAFA